MLRLLRRSVAVVFVIGCAAFCVLWWRSGTYCDGTWSARPYTSIYSAKGLIVVRITGNPFIEHINFAELWRRISVEPLASPNERYLYDDIIAHTDEPPWWEEKAFLGFAWLEEPPGATWINFPHWAAVLVCGAGTMLAALKRPLRFSLRTALFI
jgi:hypothetical protein